MNLFDIQAINATIIEEVRDILTNEYDEDDLFRAEALLTAAMNLATGSKTKCTIYKDQAVCNWVESSDRDGLDTIENMSVTMHLCPIVKHQWLQMDSKESCIINIL